MPHEATGNVGSAKRKGGRQLEKLSDVKVTLDVISQNPSRYAMMVVSSRVVDPPALDMIRQVKKVNPHIKVLIALDNRDDSKTLQGVPFIDNILPRSIESLDLSLILPLADRHSEKATLLSELSSLGAEPDNFQQCTIEQLRGLVAGLRNLIIRNGAPERSSLSGTDKKILEELLLSKGKTSSPTLSKKLHIPLTTLQRKRKRLENDFLTTRYTLKYEKFGFRRAILLINTVKGNNEDVGEKLLSFKEVLSVHKSIGIDNIDLHAEVLIKDNSELLSLIETVKAMNGVKDVVWSETVMEIGNNINAMTRIFSP